MALGLDQPVIIQYFTWLKQLLTEILDFPTAPRDRKFAAMILERLPATAILAASSIVLSLIVSIPLGIFAASGRIQKEIISRRSVHADDGDSELLCRTGIYLSVRYCI